MVGNTPLVELRRLGDGLAGLGRGEARVPEPGRLGEGPDRGRDDRRRRARRLAAAGRDDRRADERQHRDRAGDGLRGARLRARPHPARGDEPRADQAAARLRRRGPRDAFAGRDGRGDPARRADRRRARRVHAAAVLEPRQSRGPPAHHRGGDLGRPRGRGRRARHRRRHGRHDHRRRPGAQGAAAGPARDRGRARDLGGALRRAPGPAQDPGDRRRLRPRRPRPRR